MSEEVNLHNIYETVIDLILEQSRISQRLQDIDYEIDSLPKRPKNIDLWVDSIPDFNSSKRFKFSDLKKLNKLQKEHMKLWERKEEIIAKLRILLAEDSIRLIKNLEKELNIKY